MMITGYKYTVEQDAIDARKLCADYYGLPVHPDDVTQYWVNYEKAYNDVPVFWYIIFDKSIEELLGIPSVFEITTEQKTL